MFAFISNIRTKAEGSSILSFVVAEVMAWTIRVKYYIYVIDIFVLLFTVFTKREIDAFATKMIETNKSGQSFRLTLPEHALLI